MSESPGIDWSRVERRLRNAETYWLATSRPDGRPHTMPVHGLWLERAFWFGTGLDSVKGQNLAADDRAIVHLESGTDVIIVEGTVSLVTNLELVTSVVPLLAGKYGAQPEELALDGEPGGGALYVFTPELVQAWLEGDLAGTHSRWNLG